MVVAPRRRSFPSAGVVDRVDVSYYDAARDSRDAAAYYGSLATKWASLPVAGRRMRLGELLEKTHKRELAYNPAKYLYPRVDRRPGLRLESVYGAPMDAVQLGLNLLNCEHAVPRDWFDDEQPARGDLHHLFTSDSELNSARGSLKLGEGEGYFEPPSNKGALARATMYFMVRYPFGGAQYNARELQTLLKWHAAEPVSDWERHRNAEIFRLQGNRNPFIDHPEWAGGLFA